MPVYFIQMGNHGPIKIGHTRNVAKRLIMLQSANPEPLTVRLLLDGSRAEERAIHEKFQTDRIGGEGGSEWFKPSEAILSFIQSHPLSARNHVLGWLEHRYNKPLSKKKQKERAKQELLDMRHRARLAERAGRIIYCPVSWETDPEKKPPST